MKARKLWIISLQVNLTLFLFQVIMCLFAVIACAFAAPGVTLLKTVPAEALDSSIVHNARYPGGFAYSTFEGPQVNAVAPYYRNIIQPATLLQPQPYYYRAGPLPQYYGGFAYNTARLL